MQSISITHPSQPQPPSPLCIRTRVHVANFENTLFSLLLSYVQALLRQTRFPRGKIAQRPRNPLQSYVTRAPLTLGPLFSGYSNTTYTVL